MRKTTQENRSTRRTRAAIENSVLELIGQKPVNKITVQEIIDRANVCRTTFYAHYQDIYDLIESIGDAIIDEVGTRMDDLSDTPVRVEGEYPTIISVVQIYARHAEKIRLLNGPNGDPGFDKRLQDKIYESTRRLREIKDGERFDTERHRLYSCYVISGGISVLNRLLEEHAAWDATEIGHILGKMAETGEHVFLDREPILEHTAGTL